MPAIVQQIWSEEHDSETSVIGFRVQGPTTVEDVSAALMASIPPAYDYRVVNRVESITLLPGRLDLWDCRIRYAMYLEKRELKTGEMEFRFQTSGQQVTRTISLASRVFDAGGQITPTPPDARIIGWNPATNSAKGCPVDETQYSFAWTCMVGFATATEAWRRALGELRGTINSSTFFGYPAGEVKFEETNGGVRAGDDYRIDMQFTRRPNLTNVDIGGIIIPTLYGWEYVDAEEQQFEFDDSGNKMPIVTRVKVHQVLPYGNWAMLSSLLGV